MRSNDLFAYLDHYNIDASAIMNGLNQATSVDGASVSYDDNGNLTSYDGVSYGYDAENFMTSGNGATVVYDAVGRLRQTTKTGFTSTRYLHAGASLIAEYDFAGDVLRRYVHGPGVDEPVVWYEGDDTTDRRWLTADERGSIIAVANSSGTSPTSTPTTPTELNGVGAPFNRRRQCRTLPVYGTGLDRRG